MRLLTRLSKSNQFCSLGSLIVEAITNVIILVTSVNVCHNNGSISLSLFSNVILLHEMIKILLTFIHSFDNLLGKSRHD